MRRICGNEEDARDVLQSAYLSAFRSLSSFEGSCQLSTWLHRIVVNAALMRLRSKRRKPSETTRLAVSAEPMSPATVKTPESPDGEMDRDVATTWYLCSRKAFTMPAPMPWDAPVTTATFCGLLMIRFGFHRR